MQIFEGATNYVCLLFLAKAGAETCRWVRADDLHVWLQTFQAPDVPIPAKRINATEWNFAVGKNAVLLEKLQAMSLKQGDIAQRIFQGLVTGADSVFVVSKCDKGTFYSEATEEEYRLESKLMHSLCKGSVDIRRYHVGEISRSILFPYRLVFGDAVLILPSEFEREFPQTWSYLQECRNALEAREGGKWKHDRWYAFGRSQNLSEMEQSKILTPSIAASPCFTLDDGDHFYFMGSGGGGYGITLRQDNKFTLKYVLGLLNSRVLEYFIKQTSTPFRGGYFAYNRQYIEPLPISTASPEKQTTVKRLVDRILAAKQRDADADTSALEREIDDLVYTLYGLTPEEIKIVEGEK